jgi:hypothetical protein
MMQIMLYPSAGLLGNIIVAEHDPAFWLNMTALQMLELPGGGADMGPLPAQWGGLPALKSLVVANRTVTLGEELHARTQSTNENHHGVCDSCGGIHKSNVVQQQLPFLCSWTSTSAAHLISISSTT